VAGEAKAAGDGGVAKAFLRPTEEDVAGCQYCRRGDDCLRHISTVIACLKVGGTIVRHVLRTRTQTCVCVHRRHIASRESGEEWEFKFPVSSFEFSQFSKVKSSRNSSLIIYDLFTHTDPFAAV
jgi:hypothetical protein